MTPKSPSLLTIKRLFAKAKNRCAFPDCNLPIVEDSGTVTGIVCHIKARSKGGPRFDSKQTAEERHNFSNLTLLCARHSKMIDSEPSKFTVDLIKDIKAIHERDGHLELSQTDAAKANSLLQDYKSVYISAGRDVMFNSPGGIQAETVTFKTTRKKVAFTPPEGCIGHDLMQRNYTKHLIDRYNEFGAKQPNRKKPFSYAAIYSHIKKQFRAEWDNIPKERFFDLVTLLQTRVDDTRLGQINKSKGIPNYSSFDRYCREYGNQAG